MVLKDFTSIFLLFNQNIAGSQSFLEKINQVLMVKKAKPSQLGLMGGSELKNRSWIFLHQSTQERRPRNLMGDTRILGGAKCGDGLSNLYPKPCLLSVN